jgi:predicted Zn-dependent protease
MTPRLSPADIVEHALASARRSLVVIVEQEQRLDLRFAASTMTTNGTSSAISTTVIAFEEGPVGVGVGTRSATVRSTSDVDVLVRTAEREASRATPAADISTLTSGTVDDGFNDGAPELPSEILSEVARGLGAAFRRSPDELEWFGYAEATATSTWLGTTTGVRRVHHERAGRLEATGKGQQRSTSAWVGVPTSDFLDVDVAAVEAELLKRLRWARSTLEVAPGRHRLILPPGAVADLVVPLVWGASAREAREGRSAFARQRGGVLVGERIGPRGLWVTSDPDDSRVPVRPFVAAAYSGPTSSVFDNGADLHRSDWIDDGVVRHLIGPRSEQVHSPWARNAADNVIVDAQGAGTLDDVIARTDDALLVTCLWYIREVDPQTMLSTGLTRDGLYQVRDGQIIGEVGNFRFNESPRDMLSRIVDAGEAVVAQPREWADYVDSVVAPPLVIDRVNLSTRSEAL